MTLREVTHSGITAKRNLDALERQIDIAIDKCQWNDVFTMLIVLYQGTSLYEQTWELMLQSV